MKLIKSEPILCIDPGQHTSGVVIFDGKNISYPYNKFFNESLILNIKETNIRHMAIEKISSYGMRVGESIFDTVEWIGRFREAFGFEDTTAIKRKDVKMFLCGKMQSNDKSVRQAILDIFPATGGGATPQVGTKDKPGPLYGVTSHAMSALAVGLTYKYYEKISE